MSRKIEVTVTYQDIVDIKLIFDDNEDTKKISHEMNDFWSGNKDRLKDADDDIYKCVSKLIANEIIRLHMKSSFYCGVDAAVKAFEDGIEGFYPIDGSYGIKLEYCDDFELSDLEVNISSKGL